MHRTVLGNPKEVDHINRDKLDNRRSNLRPCTRSQNLINSEYRTNTSGFRGVGRNQGWWAAYVTIDGRQTTIGRFRSKAEAALAYNRKAKELYGDFARLNKIHDKQQPDSKNPAKA